MQLILLFSLSLFCPLFSGSEGLEDLGKRLSLSPPKQGDFDPILEVVQEEFNALKFHNFEKAYFFYTSKEFKKKTSLKEFILFIKSNSVLLNNQSLLVQDIKIDREIAYYKGVATSLSGVSRKINFQLVLEDGRWKILGIQLEN
ncbi:MAG TPA: DUF4864 domain-containing protein [Parachlamydiaceae bacterium]|nr:DUF4864 domain-containing protein [Parachlamydiaceae bacterium]